MSCQTYCTCHNGRRKSEQEKNPAALQEIAEKEGVSVAEVRQEMGFAITAARENPDPMIQALWQSVPRKGDEPTPEEVIAYIASIVDEKKHDI